MNSLIIIAILLVLGVGLYLYIEYQAKGWHCTEGTCEKVMGGEYKSLSDCKNACSANTYSDSRERRLLESRRERATSSNEKRVNWDPNLEYYMG